MRLNINILLIIAFLLMLGLSSCSEDIMGKPLKRTHNLNGKEFPIKVISFESEPEMHKYFQKHKLQKKKVLGMAVWDVDTNDPDIVYGCTIYVVDPKGLTDSNRFETWGHELVHCVYGSFHKELH